MEKHICISALKVGDKNQSNEHKYAMTFFMMTRNYFIFCCIQKTCGLFPPSVNFQSQEEQTQYFLPLSRFKHKGFPLQITDSLKKI